MNHDPDRLPATSTPAASLPRAVDGDGQALEGSFSAEQQEALQAARSAQWQTLSPTGAHRRSGRASWVLAVLGVAVLFAGPFLVFPEAFSR